MDNSKVREVGSGILGPICIPAEEEISPREGGSNERFRTLHNDKR